MAGLSLPTTPLRFAGGSLRAWHADDAPDLVAAWQDETIARFNAVPPEPTLQVATRWIERDAHRRSHRRALDLVVELDATPGVVGEVGLSGFSADGRGALIGYWLISSARGGGVATAAVDTFAEWAFAALELDVLVARCDPENTASQRVAERAGFAHEAHDPHGKQLWRKRPK